MFCNWRLWKNKHRFQTCRGKSKKCVDKCEDSCGSSVSPRSRPYLATVGIMRRHSNIAASFHRRSAGVKWSNCYKHRMYQVRHIDNTATQIDPLTHTHTHSWHEIALASMETSKEPTGTRLCQEVLLCVFIFLTGQTKEWRLKLKRVCGCLRFGSCSMWN